MKTHRVSVRTEIEADGSDLDKTCEELLSVAMAAAKRAYAPYSKFRVGAAALLDNGQIVPGCNQENAAYPSGLCAERVAVFYANAQYPDAKVEQLMIYAETDAGPVVSPITPCGACRQVLMEKEREQRSPIKVTLAGREKAYMLRDIASLLPLSFISDSLKGE